jgi:hypothetical protein
MAQTNLNLPSTAPKELDLAPLRRAIGTLKAPQGDLARRNARSRVKAAIRKLMADLDANYPAPPRKKVARKISSPRERRKWLIDNGWVQVMDNSAGKQMLVFAAQNRLPVKRTPAVTEPGKGVLIPSGTWVPGWVAHYYPSATTAKQAQRSSQMVQAAASAVRLGSLHGKVGVSCPKL